MNSVKRRKYAYSTCLCACIICCRHSMNYMHTNRLDSDQAQYKSPICYPNCFYIATPFCLAKGFSKFCSSTLSATKLQCTRHQLGPRLYSVCADYNAFKCLHSSGFAAYFRCILQTGWNQTRSGIHYPDLTSKLFDYAIFCPLRTEFNFEFLSFFNFSTLQLRHQV